MRAELKALRREIADSFAHAEEADDAALYGRIDELLLRFGREKGLTVRERAAARRELFDSFRGMDILQKLLDRNDITEIMVNGLSGIYLEQGSQMLRWESGFDDKETLEDVVQLMASRVNRIVNTGSPIGDLRLPDGSRVNVVLPPVAPDGPVITIRKFSREPLTMEMLLESGSISPDAALFLASAVRAGCNIFISGGTSSGKTTFLNALSACIPPEERVITIEDSLELQLQGLPNLVRLEAREANLEGAGEITIRELIRTALRMRPNRIIVGEVRGAECLDMLQAMNTGHKGSLSTGHANSAADMLSRLETMVLMGGELPITAVRKQIASALDLFVHLGRTEDKKRRVLSIEEVIGYEQGEIRLGTIFCHERGKGLIFTGRQPENIGKWREFSGEIPRFTTEGKLYFACEGVPSEPLSGGEL